MFKVIAKQAKDNGMIKQPSRETFGLLWPFIAELIEKHAQNEKLFESSSRIMKYALRGLIDKSDSLDELVKEYLKKAATLYQYQPASWFIYPVEICVPLFAHRENFSSVFEELMEMYINKTFEYIDTFDKLKAEPFIATDILSMMSRYLKTIPEVVFCSKSFENLMEFQLKCCEVEHQALSRALCSFQMDLFNVLKDIHRRKVKLPVPEEQMQQIAEYAFTKGSVIFEKYVLVS